MILLICYLQSVWWCDILLLVPSHKDELELNVMRLKKQDRQQRLVEKIEETPFITDETLANIFQVSIQTIRLDRLALGIHELSKRSRWIADDQWNETVKSLPLEDVICDVIDLELDQKAISIMTIQKEQVFTRNEFARGHYLFAQANSLAVDVINDELALTSKADIQFTRQVKLNEQVIAKSEVEHTTKKRKTSVHVHSYVKNELVFYGVFHMYRTSEKERE